MYIRKCDRCGKEIEKGEPDNELAYTHTRGSMYGYDKAINLCKECNEKFLEFMKSKWITFTIYLNCVNESGKRKW